MKKQNKKYLTREEVESKNLEIHERIDNFINERIINWEESCNSEAEGEALQYSAECMEHFASIDYRVFSDGTLTVVLEVEGENDKEKKKLFEFDWEEHDEDYDDEQSGRPMEKRYGNIVDYLYGNVQLSFDDNAESGEDKFYWDDALRDEVKVELFGMKRDDDKKKPVTGIFENFSRNPEGGKKCPECGSEMDKVCMCRIK